MVAACFAACITASYIVETCELLHARGARHLDLHDIVPYKILLNIRNISRNFGRGLTYFQRRSRGKYATRGYVFRGEAEENIEIELNMTNI